MKVFDMSGNFVNSFGKEGFGEGQFGPSHGIASNSTHIFVTVRAHGGSTMVGGNDVLIFDLAGNFAKEFGSSGSENGQFTTPQGIAVSDTHILVTDTDNSRIQVFDLAGNYVRSISRSGQPAGLTMNATHIFVTDGDINEHGRHVVTILNLDGIRVDSFGDSIRGSYDRGDEPGYFTIRELNSGIVVDDKNIFVLDSGNSRVQVFDLSGNYVTQFANPEGPSTDRISYASGLAINDTHVFVADSGNARVAIYLKDGPNQINSSNDETYFYLIPMLTFFAIMSNVKRKQRLIENRK